MLRLVSWAQGNRVTLWEINDDDEWETRYVVTIKPVMYASEAIAAIEKACGLKAESLDRKPKFRRAKEEA